MRDIYKINILLEFYIFQNIQSSDTMLFDFNNYNWL